MDRFRPWPWKSGRLPAQQRLISYIKFRLLLRYSIIFFRAQVALLAGRYSNRKMDLCTRPIRVGFPQVATDTPQCSAILNENVLFTPDEIHQACPSSFSQSIKLFQGACSEAFQKLLIKVILPRTENGDPMYMELKRGEIDAIGWTLYFDPPYEQNVTVAQPFSFTREVLVIGPKALIPFQEPLALLLAPFTSTVWLLSLLSVLVVASVDVLRRKCTNSRQLFGLGQLLALLYLMYTSNFKAVISQPSPRRLPFKDLEELATNLNLGKQRLLNEKANCQNWGQDGARELIPGLDHNYQPLCNYSSETEVLQAVIQSENFIVLADEEAALEILDEMGPEALANANIEPLVSGLRMSGFVVSKQPKKLSEHLSRTSELVGALGRLHYERLSNKRSMLRAGMVRQRDYVVIGHLKLLFVLALVGYGIALVTFLLEWSISMKRRKSLDLLASGRKIMELTMDDGEFREVAFE